jgi:hypothetical protein
VIPEDPADDGLWCSPDPRGGGRRAHSRGGADPTNGSAGVPRAGRGAAGLVARRRGGRSLRCVCDAGRDGRREQRAGEN